MRLELTEYQKSIYYNECLFQGEAVHNIGGSVHMQGQVDYAKLNYAFNRLLASQTSLRTHIVLEDGEVYQKVKDYKLYLLPFVIQSAGMSYEEQKRKIFERPMELYESDLFYFELYQVSKEEYYLSVKLHHMIADGWSMEVIFQMLNIFYEEKNITCDKLCENVYDYSEIFSFVEAYRKGNRFIKDKQYWEQAIEHIKDVAEVTVCNTRKAKRKRFYLDNNVQEGLKKYLKNSNVTVNQFFSSIFALLLSYFKQKDSVYIGIPIYNRRNATQKNTIGMFTNIIPVFIQTKGKESFKEYLKMVSIQMLEGFRHSQISYQEILSQVEENKSNLVYQYTFNYYNMTFGESFCGVSAEFINQFSGSQIYALQMSLCEWGNMGKIELDFDYNVEEYSDEMIDYMYQTMIYLCNQLLEGVDKLEDLSYVSEDELQERANYNRTMQQLQDNSIFELFTNQVMEHPNENAVSIGDKVYSYGEFYELVCQQIKYFKKKGIQENDYVCLHVEHSVYLLAAIYAIMYIGAIFVPFDKKWPEKRKCYIFEKINAKFILVDNDKDDAIKGITDGMEVIRVNELEQELGALEQSEMPKASVGERVLYVLFTSGTTGNPKGVEVMNTSLYNYILWAKRAYDITEIDSMPLYSSIAFDFTLTTIFVPLCSGASVKIYLDNETSHPIFKIIRDNICTVVKVTPSHLNIIASEKYNNDKIRAFIIGGEKLLTETIHKVEKSFQHEIAYYNEYGPTEATIGCMIYQYNKKDDALISVPIGTPINNAQIYLLDKEGKQVGRFVPGEMYIAGACLAKGYYDNIELTEERFVDNPFKSGTKMYKTGDVAKYISPDNMEYIGRIDKQVKLNGYRVELDEILSVIMQNKKVRDCAVESVTNKGIQFVVAYVVLDNYKIDSLCNYLSDYLTSYMMPRKIIEVEQIPLTINGKVDYEVLKKIREKDAKETVVENPTEVTEKEKIVIKILNELLHTEIQDVNEDFIELGGDSVKAIMFAQKLEYYHYQIKIKDILLYPRIRDIAEKMTNRTAKKKEIEKVIKENIELTPIVRRFLLNQNLSQNGSNQSIMIQLKKPITNEIFSDYLKILQKEHPALLINMNKKKELFYSVHHLEEPIQIKEYTGEECFFDLCRDVLFEVQRVDDSTFKIIMNHLVIDFVSWNVFLSDLNFLLTKGEQGQEIQLVGEEFSYADYTKQNVWNANSVIFERQSMIGMQRKQKFVYDIEDWNSNISKVKLQYQIAYVDLIHVIFAQTYLQLYHESFVIEKESFGRKKVDGIKMENVMGWMTQLDYVPIHEVEEKENDLQLIIEQYREPICIDNELLQQQNVLRINYLGRMDFAFESFILQKEKGEMVHYEFYENTDYTYQIDIFEEDNKLMLSVISEKSELEVQSFLDAFYKNYANALNFESRNEIDQIDYIDEGLSMDDLNLLLEGLE